MDLMNNYMYSFPYSERCPQGRQGGAVLDKVHDWQATTLHTNSMLIPTRQNEAYEALKADATALELAQYLVTCLQVVELSKTMPEAYPRKETARCSSWPSIWLPGWAATPLTTSATGTGRYSCWTARTTRAPGGLSGCHSSGGEIGGPRRFEAPPQGPHSPALL